VIEASGIILCSLIIALFNCSNLSVGQLMLCEDFTFPRIQVRTLALFAQISAFLFQSSLSRFIGSRLRPKKDLLRIASVIMCDDMTK
jgi:hypothetical protein